MRKEIIKQNINNCLTQTDFKNLEKKHVGKVRDIYDAGDKLILVTTDRQSAFDRILASIPFKGQVLNQVSRFWFDETKDIVPNALLEVPDPNVSIFKKCEVLPVEVVVRGYITGVTGTSAWMAYNSGQRDFCGNILPEGLKKNQKFDAPIITPTTKAEDHDEKISAEEIIKRGLVGEKDWNYISDVAIRLFNHGTKVAAENGLILVDTKYEFGKDIDGKIFLIDEVHTPDSSRYWIAESYQEKFDAGQEPENIDKEFLRLWFKNNCDPYNDAQLPEAPEELVVELSSRYIQLYEMITGKKFVFPDAKENILKRIEENLSGF
ncbi:MAG: phosphoribosylaminoimidazolesuccinocarboxamide synthase [bacterium]